MKVVCKNNCNYAIVDEDDFILSGQKVIIEKYKGGGDHLIIDKVYEVIDTEVIDFENPKECYYQIENESGRIFWYSSSRFISIDKQREKKLNELGIN